MRETRTTRTVRAAMVSEPFTTLKLLLPNDGEAVADTEALVGVGVTTSETRAKHCNASPAVALPNAPLLLRERNATALLLAVISPPRLSTKIWLPSSRTLTRVVMLAM